MKFSTAYTGKTYQGLRVEYRMLKWQSMLGAEYQSENIVWIFLTL